MSRKPKAFTLAEPTAEPVNPRSKPVAEAVRLASDDWGGDAPLLFAAERHPGCQQWGLCTT